MLKNSQDFRVLAIFDFSTLSVKTRSALIEHTVSGFAPKADVPMRALGALRLATAT